MTGCCQLAGSCKIAQALAEANDSILSLVGSCKLASGLKPMQMTASCHMHGFYKIFFEPEPKQMTGCCRAIGHLLTSPAAVFLKCLKCHCTLNCALYCGPALLDYVDGAPL